MSRIGKQPVPLDESVKVEPEPTRVIVEGPKGKLTVPLPDGIRAELEGASVVVRRRDDSKAQRSLHGLARALLANAVAGVSRGFNRELEVRGVGYRAQAKGDKLILNLGYTHPVEFAVPEGIQVSVEKQTRITVSGIDRQKVGQVAADIRALRRPDAYKGKGVRYVDEYVRRKAGKTGAK